MLCPKCGEDGSKVIRTKQLSGDNTVERIRECQNPDCKWLWPTIEKGKGEQFELSDA